MFKWLYSFLSEGLNPKNDKSEKNENKCQKWTREFLLLSKIEQLFTINRPCDEMNNTIVHVNLGVAANLKINTVSGLANVYLSLNGKNQTPIDTCNDLGNLIEIFDSYQKIKEVNIANYNLYYEKNLCKIPNNFTDYYKYSNFDLYTDINLLEKKFQTKINSLSMNDIYAFGSDSFSKIKQVGYEFDEKALKFLLEKNDNKALSVVLNLVNKTKSFCNFGNISAKITDYEFMNTYNKHLGHLCQDKTMDILQNSYDINGNRVFELYLPLIAKNNTARISLLNFVVHRNESSYACDAVNKICLQDKNIICTEDKTILSNIVNSSLTRCVDFKEEWSIKYVLNYASQQLQTRSFMGELIREHIIQFSKLFSACSDALIVLGCVYIKGSVVGLIICSILGFEVKAIVAASGKFFVNIVKVEWAGNPLLPHNVKSVGEAENFIAKNNKFYKDYNSCGPNDTEYSIFTDINGAVVRFCGPDEYELL